MFTERFTMPSVYLVYKVCLQCLILCLILTLLQGDSVQTCQGDRTWNRAQPTCVGKCVSTRPIHSFMQCLWTSFNSSFLLPSCVSSAVLCGPPPSVENAELQASGETYQSNVSYVCNPGLHLIGPQNLTCLANGTWSLPAPTCEGMNYS